ncbi:MAG: transglutaminase family protein [Deltaproteobacteria bacterium]|nr:transglutaminase family protein [Deltaproteobacteria bacterium]
MEDLQAFVEPTEVIDSHHPRIRELAAEACAGADGQAERARRLFERVRDGIRYTVNAPFHLREHYRASAVLARGYGYCVQKAVVLAAAARASGIPARLAFADIINHRAPAALVERMGSRVFTYHSYTELLLAGRWLQVTPAFDRALCAERGFPLVVFDGHDDAIFPALDEAGQPFVEYVIRRGSFADLPFEEILAGWIAAYGSERVEEWSRAAGLGG